jgi:IS5 family transposase
MEEEHFSQPMPATNERHSEELAEVDVDFKIAERPGRVKTLKASRTKRPSIIEYMKAMQASWWSTRFASSWTVRLRESR